MIVDSDERTEENGRPTRSGERSKNVAYLPCSKTRNTCHSADCSSLSVELLEGGGGAIVEEARAVGGQVRGCVAPGWVGNGLEVGDAAAPQTVFLWVVCVIAFGCLWFFGWGILLFSWLSRVFLLGSKVRYIAETCIFWELLA